MTHNGGAFCFPFLILSASLSPFLPFCACLSSSNVQLFTGATRICQARVQGAVDKSTTKKSADTDVGPEARCEYKKKQGNEAFKAKDYQQAS